MLETTFKSLIGRYNENPEVSKALWIKLVKNYAEVNRHYHTTDHLNYLLRQILPFKDRVNNWDALLFALYYHDVVYNVLQTDNEEKSALHAQETLEALNISREIIDTCRRHILATKTHATSSDPDTNLFIDADLSVLGQNWSDYQTYCQQIRNEYEAYPDTVYTSGRKKVLQHFLEMDRIYKTQFFTDTFEENARRNLKKEIEGLV